MYSEPLPLYLKMKNFYLGTKTFNSKYMLTKKFLPINEKKHHKIFQIKMRPLKIKPKAQILICHGLGGHGSRYIESAIKFADKGIQTYMFDFRGFGHSGKGGHFTGLQELLEDIFCNLKTVDENLPLFLMGHSMGGGTSLQFLRMNPDLKIAGVILHSALIKTGDFEDITFLEENLIKYAPKLAGSLVLTGRHTSPHILFKSEKSFRDFFYYDELFKLKTTVKMIKTILAISDALFTKINGNVLNYPCFGILGQKDPLTVPQFFKDYFIKSVKCEDFSFKEYKNGLHDCIQDEEGPEICGDIIYWIQKRVRRAPVFKCPTDVNCSVSQNSIVLWFFVFVVIGILSLYFFLF